MKVSSKNYLGYLLSELNGLEGSIESPRTHLDIFDLPRLTLPVVEMGVMIMASVTQTKNSEKKILFVEVKRTISNEKDAAPKHIIPTFIRALSFLSGAFSFCSSSFLSFINTSLLPRYFERFFLRGCDLVRAFKSILVLLHSSNFSWRAFFTSQDLERSSSLQNSSIIGSSSSGILTVIVDIVLLCKWIVSKQFKCNTSHYIWFFNNQCCGVR